MLKHYVMEAFEPTLLFALFCAVAGFGAATYAGHARAGIVGLIVIGAILTQMAANLIDDYIDYASGLDKETVKTPFSGGSRLLAERLVDSRNVLLIGVSAAGIAGIIGVYFALSAPAVLPIMIVGAISLSMYPTKLNRLPYVAEPLVMLNFALICVGSYIVAHGSMMGVYGMLFVAAPAGIVVGNALLVNEVPDRGIDRKYGRKSIVVRLWRYNKISWTYGIFQATAYLLVVVGVLTKMLPVELVAVLVTIPLSIIVFNGIAKFKSVGSYGRVMRLDALNTVAFLAILAVAYFA